MSVEIIEKIIQPVVDPDTDVIVYVPGYANMGPGTPTLVDSNNFTALFGDSPYIFKNNQIEGEETTIDKAERKMLPNFSADYSPASNKTYAGRPEKSWLYAKALVDAGLTVLFHRTNPLNIGEAACAAGSFKLYMNKAEGVLAARSAYSRGEPYTFNGGQIEVRFSAKYFGSYYSKFSVFVSQNSRTGSTLISVRDGAKVLEEATVSFDPSKSSFIGNKDFSYIRAVPYIGENELDDFSSLGLDEFYTGENGYKCVYIDYYTTEAGDATDAQYQAARRDGKKFAVEGIEEGEDEFTVNSFMRLMNGVGLPVKAGDDWGDSSVPEPWEELTDTETYQAVTYLTMGGYFQKQELVGEMQKIAYAIKAMALVDYDKDSKMTNIDSFMTYETDLLSTGSETAEKAKSAMFYGADSYNVEGFRIIVPDSFGYLLKLASNLKAGIPAWIPVANNPQGVVSAIASTHPVNFSLKESMVVDDGISINPIIYKQNAGYTIMGNRTLYPTNGTPGPDSFLNCQLVANTVIRAARTVAQDLQIVSTNAQEAFSTFKSKVSKTCEKMLANKDGLYSYSISKKKKTKPATIDIVIHLEVVEGIEHFVITVEQELQLDS